MIILDDLNIITRSDIPNADWTNGEARYVVDDNSELGRRVMGCTSGFEPVEDEHGNLIDIIPLPPPEVPTEDLRAAKLTANSELCGQILENEFKSTVKGDGLQPYRMNDDDQKNLLGYQSMILFGLMQDPKGSKLPMFEWKNATQIKCAADWTWAQILGLFQEYGAWKTLVLKRQDAIKERILDAQTSDDIEGVKLDYSDLLMFGGGATV